VPSTVATEHVRGSLLLVYPHRFSVVTPLTRPPHGRGEGRAAGSRPESIATVTTGHAGDGFGEQVAFVTALICVVVSYEITPAWA
jgi:hypothetical protein